MAVLTNNGTGTLKSLSLEAAFVEMCQLSQEVEDAAIELNELTENRIAVDFLTGTGSTTITANLPFLLTTGAGGSIVATAVDIFEDVTAPTVFAPADTGLTAAHYSAAVLELATRIAALEETENNLTITLNADTNVATITATIPTSFSVNGTGAIVATVDPYI